LPDLAPRDQLEAVLVEELVPLLLHRGLDALDSVVGVDHAGHRENRDVAHDLAQAGGRDQRSVHLVDLHLADHVFFVARDTARVELDAPTVVGRFAQSAVDLDEATRQVRVARRQGGDADHVAGLGHDGAGAAWDRHCEREHQGGSDCLAHLFSPRTWKAFGGLDAA
jgi:hypothetical protein